MKIDQNIYNKALQEEKARLQKEKNEKIAMQSIEKARRDALGSKKYWLSFVSICKATWKGTNAVLDKIEEQSKKQNKKKKSGKPQKLSKSFMKENKDPLGLKDLDTFLGVKNK